MPGGTMSPPGHLVSREQVSGHMVATEPSEVADDLSVVGAGDVFQDHHVDVFADESHGAVTHGGLHTTGVPAEGFVIGTAVVVHLAAFSRSAEWCIVLVGASHAGGW